ncbi:MAG: NHLP-related RiPP peptide [Xanthomonadales bacterium]|nr:NHLP-related RiPP peptide [Xanthomonadales bacterium]
MSASLPQEAGLSLLKRLASDDAFRARFEKNPQAALEEVGVPQGVIAELKSACLAPRALADKGVFEALAGDVATAQYREAMSMFVPTIKGF